MSTLTKILIILLSLASVFLCGFVVNYVATTNNYKNAYEDLNSDVRTLKKNIASVKVQLNDRVREMENLSDRLNSSISSLKTEKQRLGQDLKRARKDRSALDARINNLAAAALKFQETVSGMENSLKQTRAQLDRSRSEEIKLGKDLAEITAALTEKLALLDSMGIEQRRLLEEKDHLEKQLSQLLVPGAGPDVTMPITLWDDSARAAQDIWSAGAPLQGRIKAVEGQLATISLGSADGVVPGMVFHVIRDDAADPFICDIRITDVDSEVSAGTLQVVQSQPIIGDRVSTTW